MQVVNAVRSGEFKLPLNKDVEEARNKALTTAVTTAANEAAAAAAAPVDPKAAGGKAGAAKGGAPAEEKPKTKLMDPIVSMVDMVVVVAANDATCRARAADMKIDAVTGQPVAAEGAGVPYDYDARARAYQAEHALPGAAAGAASATATALTWWTDASAVLDVNTSALTRERAFGVADEALQLIAADKPFKIQDDDRDKLIARRTVNQIARARGEEAVVDIPMNSPIPDAVSPGERGESVDTT